MRYICLIYNSTDTDGTLTPDETNELIKAHFAFDEELLRDGIMIHSDALEMPDQAMVLRVRNNTLSATDGPYVETKEHLAGFYVIEAPDMVKAKEIAGRIPSARFGAVELRPVRTLTLLE
ncbi:MULTISPECIES: YciI family protein [Rhizobium]|uniref:Dehydrogenase n=1 Tax=Rhizobium changzhiense TaxID=2692317 RepID=A0A7Z0UAX9_9HYPH|nr:MULTISPECIES: YciI family protein [Rhizobium]MBA5805955.1 dehydrogenase [Rhizobium changzhiense]MCH4545043.1 YciI family protein [Rhizobium changzhiense]MCV9943544.1 YciI family protein [Rhizobium sp. BT-175]MCW0017110.1 YciI family protein [Rhizobium sp. BT-226]NZD59820.1 dehydrogenase [Rhizobium changzhiense]